MTRIRLLGVIAFALLAAACSRVTQENYEKLKLGMSYDEVSQILGRPTRCDESVGIRQCVWGDERHSINANFVAGKAMLYNSKDIR